MEGTLSWGTRLYAQAPACIDGPTGSDATYIFPHDLWVDGVPVEDGDLVTLSTPDGLCVGSAVWRKGQGIGLTAWGDDVLSEAVDGAAEGEPLVLRIYDASADSSRAVHVRYDRGGVTYATGSINIAEALTAAAPADLGGPFVFEPARPNPFPGRTLLRLTVAEAQQVRVSVYDALGRHVRTLVDGERPAGPHAVVWDGRDAAGAAAASGMYVYRLHTGTYTTSRTMLLLR